MIAYNIFMCSIDNLRCPTIYGLHWLTNHKLNLFCFKSFQILQNSFILLFWIFTNLFNICWKFLLLWSHIVWNLFLFRYHYLNSYKTSFWTSHPLVSNFLKNKVFKRKIMSLTVFLKVESEKFEDDTRNVNE